MKQVAIIGLGKVGALVGALLSEDFLVEGLDRYLTTDDLAFPVITGDVTDDALLKSFLKDKDGVVSCLPYQFNRQVATMAHALGLHYFDLTEDVPTTHAVRELAKTAKGAMVPQCGLAPGFIGIVGADLCKRFTKLRDIELRVGALPRYPNGLLGYSITWSPAGLINEYINDAEVIHNGIRKFVPSLEGLETINIEGQEFEAFSTSGGLGTLCESLEGKVDTLNYKTIRYPGHMKLMRFLLYELILKDQRALVERLLVEAKPPVREDVVHVYAVVEGWQGAQLQREEFYEAYHPIQLQGKEWRAISWTTAASIAAVVELVFSGALPQRGFVRQEDIGLEQFLSTKWGKLFGAPPGC